MKNPSYRRIREDNYKICPSIHPVLKLLVGEWYCYGYGSKHFFQDRVVIYSNGTVDYFCEGVNTDRGNIIYKEQQSIILLSDIKYERLFTISFDHQIHKLQKAFLVKIVAKQHQRELDIFTIGIFSKNPIKISKAQEILGDMDIYNIII